MPQDARNKLRQMGGIVASSPELMQAVQRFNNGGIPTAPALGPAPAEGFTFADWQAMSRGERRDADLPVSTIGGQLFFDRFGVGLGMVPPDARYTSEGMIREERTPSYTSDPNIISADRSLQDAFRAEEAATSGAVTRESLLALDRAKRDQLAAFAALREARLAAGDADPVDQRPYQEDLRKERLLEIYGPGSEGGPTRPQEIAARATELVDVPTDDTGGDGGDGGDGDTDAPATPTLRERYDEQLALLQEVFGEDDKDAARDKAMTLAMVGLAALVAPKGRVLRNMAEGAIVGLSAAGKRRERQREREQEVGLLALDRALASMDRDRQEQFQREMFEARAELDREIASIGALGDLTTGISAPTGNAVLDFISTASKTFLELGGATTPEEADALARQFLYQTFPALRPGITDDMTAAERAIMTGN